MAATVSSPWTKSWALDAEQHEDELNLQAQPNTKPINTPPSSDFPSLAAAATTKPKKKNKPQTLSLSEFSTYSAPKPAPEPKGLTQDELLKLPTGPRERTAEENDRTRLGGGFRNYGDRERSSRVSDRREGGRERVEMGPSRADEVDDWSKSKKFGSSFGPGPERRERGGGGGFFNSNRADEVDNWGANKGNSFISLEGGRRERRVGMGFESNGSGSDSDNWLKKKQERGAGGGEGGGESWGKKESSNGGGGGRPKLNLQPRTLPVVRSEVVTVSPTEGKVKVGANPFGEARPREEVLKEKGKDWKEIDEKLEAVKLKEEKSEGFGGGGRRRGFGAGLVDEKSVRTWRKPEANEAVASPTGSSTDATENNASAAESSAESAEGAEKVPEEN